MDAIVFVFMPAPDGQSVAEQAAAMRVVNPLPQSTESDNAGAELPEASNPDQMTPPFWTWFIENPRRCGALS